MGRHPRDGAIEGEDLVQEALILLLRGRGFCTDTPELLLATLFVMIRFTALNVGRFESKFDALEDRLYLAVPGANSAQDAGERIMLWCAFWRAIGKLPERMAGDFVAHVLYGDTAPEIAADTERHLQTVKNSICQARKRVRKAMPDWEPTGGQAIGSPCHASLRSRPVRFGSLAT